MLRSVFKPSGVWGSGLDPLLRKLRDTLRDHAAAGWPAAEVDAAMGHHGKSLKFAPEEIEALLDTKKSDARAFALLAFLFPHVDTSNRFHVDHVVPRGRLTVGRLKHVGFSESEAEHYNGLRDLLPNLQLLRGRENQSKGDVMPAEWLERRFPDDAARDEHRSAYLLGDLPDSISEFPDFYEDRRERLRMNLAEMLSG